MLRILQIGMSDNLGGIEMFLINFYRKLNKEKFQFDFINMYDNDLCFQNEIISSGGRVYKISNEIFKTDSNHFCFCCYSMKTRMVGIISQTVRLVGLRRVLLSMVSNTLSIFLLWIFGIKASPLGMSRLLM